MVDNVFKTQFELYLTNSGNNDKFHYNFYTDKWGGVYRRNIHVVEHENYISNATPNGRLMEQSPESASVGGADGVHFGGFAVRFTGDIDLPRVDKQPIDVTNTFRSLGGKPGKQNAKSWTYPEGSSPGFGGEDSGYWRIKVTVREIEDA